MVRNILVLGALATLIGASVTSSGQAVSSRTAWGMPVNGVLAGIRLAGKSDTIRVGDRLKFSLVLKNTTDRPISLGFANAQRMYGWRVHQERSVFVIAPRWRYADDEKIEKVVAGAIEFGLAPGREIEVPMDSPEFPLISPGSIRETPKPYLLANPGSRLRVKALPMTAIVRGEEWLEKLETGYLNLPVAK